MSRSGGNEAVAASIACSMIDRKKGWYGTLNLHSEDNGCVENDIGAIKVVESKPKNQGRTLVIEENKC